jgi:hypothetical protein
MHRPVEQDLFSADSLVAEVENSAKSGRVQRFFNTLYLCCTAKNGTEREKVPEN